MNEDKDVFVNENETIQEDTIREEPIQEEIIKEDVYFTGSSEEKPAKKKKGFRGSLISYIALALVASIIGGIVSPYIGYKLYGKTLPYPGVAYTAETIKINTTDDINTVSAVAKKAMGSVVGITTIEVQQYLYSQREMEGVGSGIIVDRNGYILTNSHVVGDGKAKSINVLFENGEKMDAKVLWNDSILDLAVIKVEATGLPAASLGDSDILQVGEIAVAIGNPLGLEFQRTVTSGIVSGLNRSIQIDSSNIIENLIQTDASINNGNSGGPLLNSKGEVIGINTAKIKSAEGLGFSIPINQAKKIIEEVIETGSYKTVFMGISGVAVGEYENIFGVKLPSKEGIILIQVSEDTPASEAGLLNGDIILQLDDIKIENMSQLKKSLYNYKVGEKAKLKIKRNNTDMELDIVFGENK